MTAKKTLGSTIRAALGVKEPEWKDWTPEQWAEHFRATVPGEEGEADAPELDAVVSAAKQRAERAESRKLREANNAVVRDQRRRRRRLLPVDLISTIPALAKREPMVRSLDVGRGLTARGYMVDDKGGAHAFDIDDVRGSRSGPILAVDRGRSAIHGAEPIKSHLQRKFDVVRHGTPKGHGCWHSLGGAMVPELRQIIDPGRGIESFIAAVERGETCDWCDQVPVAPLLGGALACPAHREHEITDESAASEPAA